MYKIVLLRHGESTWNKQNRFTGWTDVGLSRLGMEEAHKAGKILQQKHFKFDLVFCSVLKRAIQTMNIVLREMHINKIPIEYSWRLNERHYGALQGLNKSQMAKKYGEEQVYIWRRSYDIRPPALKKTDKRHPRFDSLYKDVPKKYLPACECLKDTVERFVPYWISDIAPAIKAGKKILISAHGNSLRALVKYLDKVSDKEIPVLNIPTGIPLVYELDAKLKPIRHYYLASSAELKKAIESVKAQGKVK
ncbi:MAG: 2,3-diphosphoglycerate-dependent phosphoglycerate mutase [Gammaproteobacteria bacterium]|nr:2,3-diphosphoglycerate-dependent phosphoglycerate mutase [Gammaproteobacteria bacterium]